MQNSPDILGCPLENLKSANVENSQKSATLQWCSMEDVKDKVKARLSYYIPPWAIVGNPSVPPTFDKIWRTVRSPAPSEYCKIGSLTQLIATCGLPVETVSKLWAMARLSSPCSLTQQELYIILALIAIMQKGSPVYDISVLQKFQEPCVPRVSYTTCNAPCFSLRERRAQWMNMYMDEDTDPEALDPRTGIKNFDALSLNFLGIDMRQYLSEEEYNAPYIAMAEMMKEKAKASKNSNPNSDHSSGVPDVCIKKEANYAKCDKIGNSVDLIVDVASSDGDITNNNARSNSTSSILDMDFSAPAVGNTRETALEGSLLDLEVDQVITEATNTSVACCSNEEEIDSDSDCDLELPRMEKSRVRRKADVMDLYQKHRKVRSMVNKRSNKLPVITEPSLVNPLDVNFRSDVENNTTVRNYLNALTLSTTYPTEKQRSSIRTMYSSQRPVVTTKQTEPGQSSKFGSVTSGGSSLGYTNPLASRTVTSSEPKSLGLPKVENASARSSDDEFTEFQSATVPNPPGDEYTDFQSASPIKSGEKLNTGKKVEASVSSSGSGSVKTSAFATQGSSSSSAAPGDKYDALRALKLEETDNEPKTSCNQPANKSDDEFGDFVTAPVVVPEPKPQPQPQKPKIRYNFPKRPGETALQVKCLEACIRLLKEGLKKFSDLDEEETLDEVLSDYRGYKYFYQLKIIYVTSQRLIQYFGEPETVETIQQLWSGIVKFEKYIPAEVKEEEGKVSPNLETPPEANNAPPPTCNLCLTECHSQLVEFSGRDYHVTCVNLFLNFVEDAEITAILARQFLGIVL